MEWDTIVFVFILLYVIAKVIVILGDWITGKN